MGDRGVEMTKLLNVPFQQHPSDHQRILGRPMIQVAHHQVQTLVAGVVVEVVVVLVPVVPLGKVGLKDRIMRYQLELDQMFCNSHQNVTYIDQRI